MWRSWFQKGGGRGGVVVGVWHGHPFCRRRSPGSIGWTVCSMRRGVPGIETLRQGGAPGRGRRVGQFERAFLAACAQHDRTTDKGKRGD